MHAALKIIGHQEPWNGAPEPKHPHMRSDPIRQTLCPGRFRVGEAGRAQHRDEDFCLAHHTGCWIDDRDLLARVVDENLVASDVVLPHAGRQLALELAEQFAVAAVRVAFRMNCPIFLP
jgi:hypothetical protein